MGIIEYIRQQRLEEAQEVAREEARTEKEISVVKNLLSDTDFSTGKIAAIAGVSIEFVEKIRQGKH